MKYRRFYRLTSFSSFSRTFRELPPDTGSVHTGRRCPGKSQPVKPPDF